MTSVLTAAYAQWLVEAMSLMVNLANTRKNIDIEITARGASAANSSKVTSRQLHQECAHEASVSPPQHGSTLQHRAQQIWLTAPPAPAAASRQWRISVQSLAVPWSLAPVARPSWDSCRGPAATCRPSEQGGLWESAFLVLSVTQSRAFKDVCRAMPV